MTPSISIQIVWPLSAQEAFASEYEHIEPSHLFLAILKFAELEEPQIRQLTGDSKMLELLVQERDGVRAKLSKSSITLSDKSKEIRYSIRKLLGKGDNPHTGQKMIHRSQAVRVMFQRAEDNARKSNSEKLCAEHLLDVLLENPSQEIKKVLSDTGVSLSDLKKDSSDLSITTPYLDRYGKDLTALASKERQSEKEHNDVDITRNPVSKVVIEYILGSEKKNILLIQKGTCYPEKIVSDIAKYFVCNAAPSSVQNKRIVEIDASKLIPNKMQKNLKESEEVLCALFQEIVNAGNIIPFLSNLHIYLETEDLLTILEVLKELLSKDGVCCIAGIDERNYQIFIEKDFSWRKLIRPVWIHDVKVPLQL